MFEKVKAFFGMLGKDLSGSDKIAAQKKITGNLAGYIVDLSKFHEMEDNAVYSQLYAWESEVGGAVDKVSTLVAQSYQGITFDPSKGLKTYSSSDKIVIDMMREASMMTDSMGLRSQFEMLTELLMIYGNVYLVQNKDLTFDILPPEYVSFVEDQSQIGMASATHIITKPKYLVLNEKAKMELEKKVYNIDKIIHIKYKDTPQIISDLMNRKTFGIYSVSPLHRTVLPIWWKRQLMVIDTLWRARSIPREHHQISAEAFSLDTYDGADWATKRARAKLDAETFMNSYSDSIVDQAPDQGYVTTSAINIKTVGGAQASSYMKTNELLSQIEEHIWTALNVPPSIVNGKGASSYASELVISNYVSSKVIQLANKIKPILLKNLRDRLLAINKSFPVETLDIKLELSMAASEIEKFRQLALMADIGVFTKDEIRDHAGWEPLPEGAETVQKSAGSKVSSAKAGGDTKDGNYPDTPQSDEQHTRDASQEALRSNEQKI